ncbi:DUF411 domain-containing protein [Microvirga sp. CF3062]|uniref:DUF411 domain-containing protein n=1 Tax=Microvirga sp. CF3062 TaxID=3110182 RepID=UPI002E76EF2E|nr:DUF411 domain-containing protein [Microvirga sp. CF3062]MEE1657847.1 DUF411 domain-containing protein [Microvirga sp. CF3062]
MGPNLPISRRALLAGLATSTLVMTRTPLAAETLQKMVVTKDPNCGCCTGWVKHVRAAGFDVEVVESSEINRLKIRLGVPEALASCHTAEIGGYVIEGHVPPAVIKRLLAEKPDGRGLAVPGMPVGSPGMEVEGVEPDTYEVVLFGPSGQRTYARYTGGREA